MKRNYVNGIILSLTITMITWILSCSGKPGMKSEKPPLLQTEPEPELPAVNLVRLVFPAENAEIKLNEKIKIVLELESRVQPDSIKIIFEGKPAGELYSSPWEFEIPASLNITTGRKSIKITAYRHRNKPQIVTSFITVISDIVPARQKFRVINTFPHDPGAFTQGLFFRNGYLYESTGQEKKSTLRKVDLQTGEVLNQHNLDPDLFGEGITFYDGKIYQLTWQSKVGFIYDFETLRLLSKFYYQTEGWGIATMGNRLIMSDGSNVLYIIDPGMFLPVSQLEVYDNKSKVSDLNELEYIKGEIWANIWNTDLIARIDPHSGKVLAYIDLKGIMNDPSFDTSVNVLNGIAYDSDNDRIFVTGKNWHRLFEIKVIE